MLDIKSDTLFNLCNPSLGNSNYSDMLLNAKQYSTLKDLPIDDHELLVILDPGYENLSYKELVLSKKYYPVVDRCFTSEELIRKHCSNTLPEVIYYSFKHEEVYLLRINGVYVPIFDPFILCGSCKSLNKEQLLERKLSLVGDHIYFKILEKIFHDDVQRIRESNLGAEIVHYNFGSKNLIINYVHLIRLLFEFTGLRSSLMELCIDKQQLLRRYIDREVFDDEDEWSYHCLVSKQPLAFAGFVSGQNEYEKLIINPSIIDDLSKISNYLDTHPLLIEQFIEPCTNKLSRFLISCMQVHNELKCKPYLPKLNPAVKKKLDDDRFLDKLLEEGIIQRTVFAAHGTKSVAVIDLDRDRLFERLKQGTQVKRETTLMLQILNIEQYIAETLNGLRKAFLSRREYFKHLSRHNRK